MKRYKVICTIAVAEEMVRYERATIVYQSAGPIEATPEWFDEELKKAYERYEFTIESPAGCVEERWRSFDVTPQEV